MRNLEALKSAVPGDQSQPGDTADIGYPDCRTDQSAAGGPGFAVGDVEVGQCGTT